MKFPSRTFVLALALLTLAASLPAAIASNSPDADSAGEKKSPPVEFMIPGPLRSFLRMAGISQKITAQEVFPLLSRNIVMQGYDGSGHQTEFLILLRRYVVQARELTSLAATSGMTIRVTSCEDVKPLLRILGYRSRPDCGNADTTLQTDDAERAFLTIDSGFPLPELEQTLQGGKPFEYAYPSSAVPVQFAESDWTMASRNTRTEAGEDFLDTILTDQSVARLYWALSKLDPDTADALQQSIGIRKMLPYAAVLDFYGSHLCIRDGHVVVPGGSASENAWSDLVGVNPASAGPFVQKLLSRDKGWLMAYFDVLSRISRSQQAYFVDPRRLHVFYEDLRAPDPSAKATVGSFRPAPSLLVLVTRLHFDSAGEPIVPGNLEIWRDILRQKSDLHAARAFAKRARIATPDELIGALFAFSRVNSENGPLQIYSSISELDSGRSPDHRLSPATVRVLARKFDEFSDQYRIFGEFSELNDASITSFLSIAQTLNTLPNPVRGNALGTFQANAGIWQILARQAEISSISLNDSWQETLKPFAKIRTAGQVYDAGAASLEALLKSASGKPAGSQDEIIQLLAGPRQTTADGKKMHQEYANNIRSVLDGQRLVSLDTILMLGNALRDKSQGRSINEFVIRRAAEVREFEMPRPIFTSTEHVVWAPGIYNNHHTEAEMRTDILNVLKDANPSSSQLDEARGQLASFLRDTLVGLNYAYYEPPGAQALHNNPLFVRSHDFAAESVAGIKTVWQAPRLLGQGTPAGGGAHFVGSLADLPYVLADLEQDFIAPENVQALISKELTPGLLTSAVLPRWWNVSQEELHAAALYQRSGEELLAASASNEDLRAKVLAILSDRMAPRQTRQLERALRTGNVAEILPQVMPADVFYLTLDFQRTYPKSIGDWGSATRELQDISAQHPDLIGWKRLSHDFGVPHPSLAQTYGSDLLNVRPMPAFSGNASRYLAESWDSTNLYWARLADETGRSAVTMNHLVPELTHHMVEKIFATDFEDWPALLRAMHETGDEFRHGKVTSLTTVETNPAPKQQSSR